MQIKLIGLLAIITLAFAPAKKQELQFKLKKDTQYKLSTTMENITKQTMMGQEMVITANIQSAINFELKEEGSESDQITMWYGDIAYSVSQMGNKQEFRSDTTALEVVDPLSALLANITERKFVATVTRKGIVDEVSGLEEIIAAALGGDTLNPVNNQVTAGFGDTGLAFNLENTTNIFPDHAVKEGDSWTIDQMTSTGFPLLAKNKYTLTSIRGDRAEISVVGTLETDPENQVSEAMGMEALIYLEGSRKGTLTIELATGWVTEGSFTDDFSGSITLSPNPQIPDGMTVPVEVKINTTVKG